MLEEADVVRFRVCSGYPVAHLGTTLRLLAEPSGTSTHPSPDLVVLT